MKEKGFSNFIKEQDKVFYDKMRINIIGGKEGKWIEIKFPQDKTDQENEKEIHR